MIFSITYSLISIRGMAQYGPRDALSCLARVRVSESQIAEKHSSIYPYAFANRSPLPAHSTARSSQQER